MSSRALYQALNSFKEAESLLDLDPTPPGEMPEDVRRTRAIRRGAVVLLSGHFEAYVRNSQSEMIQAINDEQLVDGAVLAKELRLRQLNVALKPLTETAWLNREQSVRELILREGSHWDQRLAPVVLDADRILEWTRTPTAKNLIRLFRMWGIQDVFGSMTRAKHTRDQLFVDIDQLVKRRNQIAHGDTNVDPTREDVRRYIVSARTFATRADRQLARSCRNLLSNLPW
ncbi:MAG: hypothetical protein LC723_07455 [Actinobacteria bacterium]|nr:hypothetical protein [Actinomycetota bacterium]